MTPVITITLYWGENEWDGPRSLHEMFQKVDERLKPYLPDYRINLLVPQEIYASVRDGDYSAARGAEKLGITVQELKSRMQVAGYIIPTETTAK